MTGEEAIRIIEEDIQIDVRSCTNEEVHSFITALNVAIAALREQPRWISVEERLPEIYQTVLAYRENLSNPGGYMTMEYITRAYGNANQWSNDLNTWKSKVTHWMPLPDAPEVEV